MRTLFLLAAAALGALAPATHRLEATPSTIAYGWYDAAGTPVLRIASGDIIDVDTLLTNTPMGLSRAGVPDDQIQESLKKITEAFRAKTRSAAPAAISSPGRCTWKEPRRATRSR